MMMHEENQMKLSSLAILVVGVGFGCGSSPDDDDEDVVVTETETETVTVTETETETETETKTETETTTTTVTDTDTQTELTYTFGSEQDIARAYNGAVLMPYWVIAMWGELVEGAEDGCPSLIETPDSKVYSGGCMIDDAWLNGVLIVEESVIPPVTTLSFSDVNFTKVKQDHYEMKSFTIMLDGVASVESLGGLDDGMYLNPFVAEDFALTIDFPDEGYGTPFTTGNMHFDTIEMTGDWGSYLSIETQYSLGGETLTVSGAALNDKVCGIEFGQGEFSMQGATGVSFTFDGLDNCDGCAPFTMSDGFSGETCGLFPPR